MGFAQIREATAADLAELAALMGVRDGLSGPMPGAKRALLDLDPARIRVWVAVDHGAVVAMTCAELRRLQIGDAVIDAGYWTNLYIRDDHRDQLLYPRLPQAMLRGLAKAGVERVYLAIRRLDVAAGHLRIGFCEIDRLVVRLKPLRPLSLLSKHRQLGPALVRAAGTLDRIAGLPLRVPGYRPRSAELGDLSLTNEPDLSELARLSSSSRVGAHTRRWDANSLAARYQPAADGARYSAIGLRRGGALLGAAVDRITTREQGLRVAVIMELAARNDDRRILADLLRAIERRAHARGADGVLVLDSLGPAVSRVLRAAAYLDTGERYVLMVAPKRAIAAGDPILDPSAWRLPLSDHDAF